MVYWIWKYVSKSKGLFVITLFLLLVETLALLSTIGLQQRIIDEVFINGQHELLWEIILLFILAFVLYSTLFTLVPYFIFKNTDYVRRNLTSDLLKYIHSIPLFEFKRNKHTNLVYNFTNDIGKVAYIFTDLIPRGFQQIFSVFILFIIIGVNSPLLLIATIFFSIIYFLLGRYFGPKRKALNKDIQHNKSNMLNIMEENISGTKEIISFNRKNWAMDRFNNHFKNYFSSVMVEGKMENKNIISSEPIRWGAILLTLSYGIYLVNQGSMSVGTFVVIFQFTTMLMDSLQRTFYFFIDFSGNSASIERLKDEIGDIEESKNEFNFNDSIRSIEFKNITFGYGRTIFNNFTCTIPVGSKVAFVGKSGSGKSTLIQLLVKFVQSDKGEILINGVDLNQIPKDVLAKKMSVVFQEPYFFHETIKYNLLFGREGYNHNDLVAACTIAGIHKDILELPDQYDTILTERGYNLSGGQRQRLAIARAILTDPDVLFLDESTSALDLETERELQESIDGIRLGKTTIIIAHRLSTIINADKIFVLDEGTIVGQGTHYELLRTNSKYKELIGTDIREITNI
ncbi:ABC transporter ATP-binding protein [Jeotgalibacillus sp. ET6]|uniref:ABC transporter ATP-binding protein n=1 Tax=Jeotgalibacillus sp. ET6 TaxID=3037260 RepID=UPI002418545A|nr:ABC transporter ATP-binding protein [Jeotgalibacillus sp. ET6]MDG5473714.1 ABC transporter ATP-binding protein [Jeotgalibacillus sp. ET6]